MTKRKDVPVKVDEEVVRKARIAASYRGIPLAEYISETLRPIVDRDIEESHEKLRQKEPIPEWVLPPKRSKKPPER